MRVGKFEGEWGEVDGSLAAKTWGLNAQIFPSRARRNDYLAFQPVKPALRPQSKEAQSYSMLNAAILSPLMTKLKSRETGLPGKFPVTVAVSTVFSPASLIPEGAISY
jgi:hypothetical protein